MQKGQELCMRMEKENDILIFDTVGGRNYNTTKRAWHVFEYTNHKQRLLVYQDKIKGKVYPIVHAVTKAWIQGRDLPILLVMDYITLLYDIYNK